MIVILTWLIRKVHKSVIPKKCKTIRFPSCAMSQPIIIIFCVLLFVLFWGFSLFPLLFLLVWWTMYAYTYVYMCVYFFFFFFFWKEYLWKNSITWKWRRWCYFSWFNLQRSHTFIQQKQNDSLTNNPPNNLYTWTNEWSKKNNRKEKKETIHTQN